MLSPLLSMRSFGRWKGVNVKLLALTDEQLVMSGTFAAVGTFLSWLVGGWTTPLAVLIVFILLDYATGVMSAYSRREASSAKSIGGIIKKLGMLAAIVFAHMLDTLMGIGDPFIRTATIWLLLGNEAVSIAENMAELGVPLPDRVSDAIRRLKGRSSSP